jgi:nicotinamidase-related amidase
MTHRAPRSWTPGTDHVGLAATSAPPQLLKLAARPQRITVDLARSALVVVDMQRDFCAPGGWLSSIGIDVAPAAAAVAPINAVTPVFRAAEAPVIWLNWGARPDRLNLPPNVLHVYDAAGTGGGIGDRAGASDAVLTKDSWGAAPADGLDLREYDIHVDKFRMSGFFDTPLDSILRGFDVTTVFFAGVNADQCVLATLMDAACLGYDVILIEGAAATTSPGFCLDATVYNVRQCFGFTVGYQAIATSAPRLTSAGAPDHRDR